MLTKTTNMKIFDKLSLVLLLISIFTSANAQIKRESTFEMPYGNNDAVGKYATVNGVKMYFEEYGSGEPLLLIHGNSGEIKNMDHQIDYFKNKYRVIVADSRGHGKSGVETDSLTYTQMTKDWEGLVAHLKLDSIHILGVSDGGIIALKMGISGKTKIKKIVAMGANLRPDETAVNSWAINEAKGALEFVSFKAAQKDTSKNWPLGKQVLGLLVYQPNIPKENLSKITAKVLIIAGDKDVIKNQHSVEIFEHIPNAHLCIMPGQTHFATAENATYFNGIVDTFLSQPFSRPDSDWTKKRK
tara:strand:- start:61153 stop:62052 length:900 start_codon:yes stop_codon:yes gene_type:complete